MNERVMQFRIGMFVIVAGLVLTMLIVWFGESPSLFRDSARTSPSTTSEAPAVERGGARCARAASASARSRRSASTTARASPTACS